MTPEQTQKFNEMQYQIQFLMEQLNQFKKIDRYFIDKNIELPTEIGIKLGNTAKQKLGYWGTKPVVQPSAIADVAAGGADSDGGARAKINLILAALRLPGSIAT